MDSTDSFTGQGPSENFPFMWRRFITLPISAGDFHIRGDGLQVFEHGLAWLRGFYCEGFPPHRSGMV